MLIKTSQSRLDRQHYFIKFCNVLLSAEFVPAVVGKDVGAKVSWLDAGSLDAKPGQLLAQGFGVDGYSSFGGAV